MPALTAGYTVTGGVYMLRNTRDHRTIYVDYEMSLIKKFKKSA